VELEFHLLDPTKATPQVAGAEDNVQQFTGPQTYNLEHLADYNAFLDAISDACILQNIPLSSALTEFGEGQFELNLQHTDDVQAACNHSVLLKRVVRQVARQQGFLATFMAKPFAGNAGNGMHIHLSLADNDGQSLFSTQGHELSPVLSQALAGMLTSMPESMALFAPNANSYRRFEPDTFVPLIADWGHDHRAVAIRLPRAGEGDCRIEHRTAGADANPYLVVAAILAGLLHGVESGLDAPPATSGNTQSAAASLPLRWIQALDEFERGSVIARYLGTEFCDIYHQVKRDEERHYHHLPSQQDYDLYLRLV
jgi:glutamine synthetase